MMYIYVDDLPVDDLSVDDLSDAQNVGDAGHCNPMHTPGHTQARAAH